VWACAILPDHVHLVIGRSPIPAERLVIQLKSAATRELELEGIHPLAAWSNANGRSPRTFVQGQWIVYLDPGDVERAIRYVERNPLKENKPLQHWSFVEPAPAF
jgi:REP element-mobilizing transposase RayT